MQINCTFTRFIRGQRFSYCSPGAEVCQLLIFPRLPVLCQQTNKCQAAFGGTNPGKSTCSCFHVKMTFRLQNVMIHTDLLLRLILKLHIFIKGTL